MKQTGLLVSSNFIEVGRQTHEQIYITISTWDNISISF